ncbi:MAG: amidohydrolase family protein [Acidobacteriota bacterium]
MTNSSAPSRVFLLLALAGLLLGCPADERGAEVEDPGIAFVGVSVLAPNDRWLDDQTLLVRGAVITALGARDEVAIPDGVEVISGEGRYVVPGLVDSHVHLDDPSELDIYPTYGITTVVNLRGVGRHLRWRDEIARGERFGPRLVTAGDYLDGDPPWMEPMTSVTTPEDAAQVVREQKQAGYDLVKVYSQLSTDQLRAITAAAREVGTVVVGHASNNYDLETLIAAGQSNVAHGQQLLRWYLPESPSDAEIDTVARQLAAGGVSVTPNLSWTLGLLRQGEDLAALLEEPDAGWLHPAVLQPWRPGFNRYIRDAETWVPDVRQRFEIEKRLVSALHQAGVTLLAGTDASTSGVYPGASLHDELLLLEEAGLTPAQALATATRNPGELLHRWLPQGPRSGEISVGMQADLLLVEGDPLADLGRLRRPAGTMLAGRWHPRSDLEARRQQLVDRFAILGPVVEELESALFAGDVAAARPIFDAWRRDHPQEQLFAQYPLFFASYRFLYGADGFQTEPKPLETALELYRMYAETYPEYHSSHYLLGEVYRALGRDQAAASAYREALRLHPLHPRASAALEEIAAGSPASKDPA